MIALRLPFNPWLALGLALPGLLGLALTGELALGHMPVIGAHGPSLDPLRQALAVPGLVSACALSLFTGLMATVLALGLASLILLALGDRAITWLSPVLAVPHLAFALGLAFLIAPSGLLVRLAGPVTPPDIALLHDPYGLGLILGMTLKEVPFFLFVLAAAWTRSADHLSQVVAQARSLGHSRANARLWLVLPRLVAQIRLPILIVLAYSVSVTDLALVLGPANPPTLAVLTLRVSQSPDLASLMPAAVLALLQLGLIGVALACLVALSQALRGLTLRALWRGLGGSRAGVFAEIAGKAGFAFAVAISVLAMTVLVLWAFANQWPWPDLLPRTWSPDRIFGARAPFWALLQTLTLASLTAVIAIVAAVLVLEASDRAHPQRVNLGLATAAISLVVPQAALVFALDHLALRLGLRGGLGPVLAGHLALAFPYALLSLSGPWLALDRRLIDEAASLGANRLRRLVTLKLPLLRPAILSSFALAFAVSVSSYLPTLVLGQGRIITLTTEAVAASTGSDRRLLAATALLQAALPLLVFSVCLWLQRRAPRLRAA